MTRAVPTNTYKRMQRDVADYAAKVAALRREGLARRAVSEADAVEAAERVGGSPVTSTQPQAMPILQTGA